MEGAEMIRVAAIDDHPLMLQLIEETISRQPDLELAGSASHGRELLPLARKTRPDVVILDLLMAEGAFDPLQAVQDLRQEFPKIRVLVLTGEYDPASMRSLLQAGVQGYVLKSDPLSLKLPEGIRKVFQGKHFVSDEVLEAVLSSPLQAPDFFLPSEMAILRLLDQGLNNAGISEVLKISEGRVRNALSGMYDKAGIQNSPGLNRREALRTSARALGLLD